MLKIKRRMFYQILALPQRINICMKCMTKEKYKEKMSFRLLKLKKKKLY
jgi:hypothetical protein